MTCRQRMLLLLGGGLVAAVVAPPAALAHGLVGRADLPIPDWLFTWGATAVLVVSFVALATLWPEPRLQRPRLRPIPYGDRLTSRPAEIAAGTIGVALLVLTIVAGYAGAQVTNDNWAPTFVYVAFWLGLVPVSIVCGDVFRAFNPWRAIGRVTGTVAARLGAPTEPLTYPERLGHWPAAAGLFAFGWLELVSLTGDRPSTVATAALIYSAVTFVGMALYGVEAWCAKGEAFGVYFGLLARMSPVERTPTGLALRPPLSRLPRWEPGAGGVALLATMIGVVSFDGLSAGKPFNDALGGVIGVFRDDLGLGPGRALQTTYGISMVAVVAIAAGLFLLGIRGAQGVDPTRRRLADRFVHTLVPIAVAYVGAHYVSLLLLQGQALGYLASDPLGDGADLLGTADWTVDYRAIGAELFWYLQVGFVVLGHVAGLILAHDRALAVYDKTKAAVRSQYWLLGVMVVYTTLALWLLAQAREG